MHTDEGKIEYLGESDFFICGKKYLRFLILTSAARRLHFQFDTPRITR